MYIVGMGAPIMTIPQVAAIWVRHTTAGISLVTWTGYSVFSFLWLLYGFYVKDKPVALANVFAFLLNLCVVGSLLLVH
jgi:uncharacterized protein with PQ loop repeat